MVPGAPCCDAPVRAAGQAAWLLPQLGQRFTGLLFCGPDGIDAPTREALPALQRGPIPLTLVVLASAGANEAVSALDDAVPDALVLHDTEGLATTRYDATPGTFYLIRPDQHVCARWRRLDADKVEHALKQALCVAGTA